MNFDPVIANWIVLQLIRGLTFALSLLAASSICVFMCKDIPHQRERVFLKLGFFVLALGYLFSMGDKAEPTQLHSFTVNLGIWLVALRTILVSGGKTRMHLYGSSKKQKNPA